MLHHRRRHPSFLTGAGALPLVTIPDMRIYEPLTSGSWHGRCSLKAGIGGELAQGVPGGKSASAGSCRRRRHHHGEGETSESLNVRWRSRHRHHDGDRQNEPGDGRVSRTGWQQHARDSVARASWQQTRTLEYTGWGEDAPASGLSTPWMAQWAPTISSTEQAPSGGGRYPSLRAPPRPISTPPSHEARRGGLSAL